MSNRRKLRRYRAGGTTPNPYRTRPAVPSPRGPGTPAPVWRESSRPLLSALSVPRGLLFPGRRGDR